LAKQQVECSLKIVPWKEVEVTGFPQHSDPVPAFRESRWKLTENSLPSYVQRKGHRAHGNANFVPFARAIARILVEIRET
jgi:hypothetical protein